MIAGRRPRWAAESCGLSERNTLDAATVERTDSARAARAGAGAPADRCVRSGRHGQAKGRRPSPPRRQPRVAGHFRAKSTVDRNRGASRRPAATPVRHGRRSLRMTTRGDRRPMEAD